MCLENSGGAGRIGVHRRESRSSALAYGLSTVGLNEWMNEFICQHRNKNNIETELKKYKVSTGNQGRQCLH